MITLRLTENESQLITEALLTLMGKKTEAFSVLSKAYPGRGFEPKDFAIPQIHELIAEINAKEDDPE